VTLATSWINYAGVRLGANVNNVTAWLKLAALAVLAGVGPLVGGASLASLLPLQPADAVFSWSAVGLALSPVLFSYLGWNASVYVASEIQSPQRNVPRSLFAGLGI